MEDAQRALEGTGHPVVIAHLQYALDLLRGEAMLVAGSPRALRIERRFARLAANDPQTPG